MAPKLTLENFDKQKFIEKELRRAFKRSPLYNEAKNRAKHEYFEPSKHGKPQRRVHYKCAQCGRFFRDEDKNIAVDHREPVVDPVVGFVDANTYVDRLFCDIDNLWVLCNYPNKRADEHGGVLSCHKIKTKAESAIAAEAKRRNKQNGDDL
jgi:hypothetical protein